MIVSVDEIKEYLRVDFDDEDSLINVLIQGATKLCMDIVWTENEDEYAKCPNSKIAIMYAVAYLYEHREDADHHALTITLRSLLFGNRKESF